MNHADALAELAKDFPPVLEVVENHAADFHELDSAHVTFLLTLAATEHAQRKQLESRVEKLRNPVEFHARICAHCIDVLAADDALAKEQPKC